MADSVAFAAAETDVMVVCLLDHQATREAVMRDDVGAALRGKVLVQFSTTSPEEVEELARWADGHGIEFLRGGIYVYPSDIRAGKGRVLYGGSSALFDRLRPILDAMGGQPCWISDRPADTVGPQIACYCFLYSAVLSFIHAAAISHRSGFSAESFTRQVIEPFVSGGALMTYLDSAGRAAARRRYDEDFQATLDTWNDGLRQMIGVSEALNIDTSTLKAFKTLLDNAADKGYGDQDIAAVFETLIASRS